MKILGIDTTSNFLSLGVYDNGLICEYDLELTRKHSSLLAVTLKRVIDALGWDLKEINYLACGLGPGSFTGVRIGLSTLKGIAFALNKPIVGVSTLDILAMNASRDGMITPIIDAKRNLIYYAIYRSQGGKLKRITPYRLVSIGDFLKKVNRGSFLLGDACGVYKEEIKESSFGLNILDKDYWYPKGRNLVSLALEQVKNKKNTDAFKIKPIYLYPKECQIKNVC